MERILNQLEEDCRINSKQLAAMNDMTESEVSEAIEKYEKDGTILGYSAIIDWDKTDRQFDQAIIELNITPSPDIGFDRVAETIANFPEVKSIYLASGSFDLALIVEGKCMKDIAYFVAKKLSTINGVTSTATHFIMKKYKDKGVVFSAPEEDERGNNI